MKKFNLIMRLILVVAAISIYFISSCFAYEVKDKRVLYDAYEVSVMTVTDGSEKNNQLYWASSKNLEKNGKDTMFHIYNRDKHPGEWITMFPNNDEVVGITAKKSLVDEMVKSVAYARYHQLEDCTWRISVLPCVYFILRNESNGKISEFDRAFIDDNEAIKYLSDKYSDMVASKGTGYHAEIKPFYMIVVMKYNNYSQFKFYSDFSEGRIPLDMYLKNMVGIDVSADYRHEMYNQTHPWAASEEWRRDYARRQFRQILVDLQMEYNDYYKNVY